METIAGALIGQLACQLITQVKIFEGKQST